ncbi:MAG TPA: hypothetical protein VLC08_15815 [Chitinolyticbacter sp.]|nr:hypothetical protein [Chitinolyticbacter sp.]
MRTKQSPLSISDKVIIIGYNPEGVCVYSASMPWGKYYDGDHPWDDNEEVKQLRLQKVHGYLFDSDGALEQEFESQFDVESGFYSKGWAKFADGTFNED